MKREEYENEENECFHELEQIGNMVYYRQLIYLKNSLINYVLPG